MLKFFYPILLLTCSLMGHATDDQLEALDSLQDALRDLRREMGQSHTQTDTSERMEKIEEQIQQLEQQKKEAPPPAAVSQTSKKPPSVCERATHDPVWDKILADGEKQIKILENLDCSINHFKPELDRKLPGPTNEDVQQMNALITRRKQVSQRLQEYLRKQKIYIARSKPVTDSQCDEQLRKERLAEADKQLSKITQDDNLYPTTTVTPTPVTPIQPTQPAQPTQPVQPTAPTVVISDSDFNSLSLGVPTTPQARGVQGTTIWLNQARGGVVKPPYSYPISTVAVGDTFVIFDITAVMLDYPTRQYQWTITSSNPFVAATLDRGDVGNKLILKRGNGPPVTTDITIELETEYIPPFGVINDAEIKLVIQVS